MYLESVANILGIAEIYRWRALRRGLAKVDNVINLREKRKAENQA